MCGRPLGWASFAADAAHLVGLNITAVDMLGKHVGDDPGQVRSLPPSPSSSSAEC